MRFSFVTFLASLVLIQNLYAAPIEETKQKSNPNEDHLSNTVSAGPAAASYYVNLLQGSGIHVNPLTSTFDTPQSPSIISLQCCWENCNQSFNEVSVLNQHIDKSHIVKEEKYYKCKWQNCNHDSYKIYNLRCHLRTHTGERPFVCQYDGCGQSFAQTNTLKRHMKTIHSSVGQVISRLEQESESLELNNGKDQQQEVLHCDWKNCNRNINDANGLTDHVQKDHIGSGKSLYECQWKDCSYTGKHRKHMISHVRAKHTNYRPFICSHSDCGKSFTQKSHLKEHEQRHLSKRYFLCPLQGCDKKYSNIETIRSHLFFHAAAAQLSISDVESIWNAFRKKIPYPADISSRFKLKEERFIETNEKSNNGNEDYSETSTNETEGNISSTENNEIYISDAGLHSTLSEVTSFDESVTNDKDNMEAANHSNKYISCAENCKDGTELNAISKRPFEFDNNFDYASKRIKSTDSDNSECNFPYRQEQNDHQNLKSPFSPLSLKAQLEQLVHSISNELDAEYFIEFQ